MELHIPFILQMAQCQCGDGDYTVLFREQGKSAYQYGWTYLSSISHLQLVESHGTEHMHAELNPGLWRVDCPHFFGLLGEFLEISYSAQYLAGRKWSMSLSSSLPPTSPLYSRGACFLSAVPQGGYYILSIMEEATTLSFVLWAWKLTVHPNITQLLKNHTRHLLKSLTFHAPE